MQTQKTLVLGIGNTLLTDEGIGVHVVEYLRSRHPETDHITFLDGGTLSFSLAADVSAHGQLIVVDAARTGNPPAAVCVYEGQEMDRYLKGNRQSVHEVGLGDLLDIARLGGHFPGKIALVGIEPFSMEWGDSPSEVVCQALPIAAGRVMSLIARWEKESC